MMRGQVVGDDDVAGGQRGDQDLVYRDRFERNERVDLRAQSIGACARAGGLKEIFCP